VVLLATKYACPVAARRAVSISSGVVSQQPRFEARHTSPHAAGAAREIVVAMPPREGQGGGAVADAASSRHPDTRVLVVRVPESLTARLSAIHENRPF
jgi:hypothetical protein